MKGWRAHRAWMGIMILAVVIGAGNKPLLGLAQQKAAQKLAILRKEEDMAVKSLDQLQKDIAAAEQMKSEINVSEADKFMLPVDRLRTAQILEHRAAEAHLTKFTYNLSPEQKTFFETIGAGRQELATSKLTLQADAPTDADVYTFLDAVAHTLPGRFALRQFSLQRGGDSAITDDNLRVTASGDWLSNGAIQNLAEGTP